MGVSRVSSYPKYCEACKVQINKNDNHFSGVPDVGELCNPCHHDWYAEVEKIRGAADGSEGEDHTVVE